MRARAFALGYIERLGEFVTVAREHGAYIVRRSPRHAAGHACEGARTLTDARRVASRLRRER